MTARLRSHWTGAALVAVLLAAAHTWPLATAPGTLSLHHNGDVLLNEWIVAWVQHQLLRAPHALFQANIFHPAPDALAFSEPLLVPALLGAPVRALGGSPVLVHNLLLLAGLALTLLGTYALAHHWTGDPLASLVAGAAFAFNTQSLMRLEHLQAAHAHGLPLALLAADRLIETGRRRHALWLALWMVAMAGTSGYLVIFAAVALAVLVAARANVWPGQSWAASPSPPCSPAWRRFPFTCPTAAWLSSRGCGGRSTAWPSSPPPSTGISRHTAGCTTGPGTPRRRDRHRTPTSRGSW
jgi:hypothetical protein